MPTRFTLHSLAMVVSIALLMIVGACVSSGSKVVLSDTRYDPDAEPVVDPTALPNVSLWTYKGKAFFGSAPVAVGNRLIFPTRKGRLDYVDPNSGKRTAEAKAKYTLEDPPLITHERIFVITDYPRNRLQALDVESGKRLWHRDFSPTIEPPIRVGGELWVPVGDSLIALAPHDGDRLRAVVSDGDRWLTPSPWSEGFALLGARGVIRYLDSSGVVKWERELNEPCAESPVTHSGDVVVVSASGSVFRLAGSGDEIWRRRLADDYLHAPVVADDLLYVVGRGGVLWALDGTTGDSVWARSLGAPGSGTPLVRGDWLAATSVDGKLWFLDRRDGSVRDSVTFEALIHHPPVWAFGRLYIVTSDKRAHAFGTGP